jgi:hypothetical protein
MTLLFVDNDGVRQKAAACHAANCTQMPSLNMSTPSDIAAFANDWMRSTVARTHKIRRSIPRWSGSNLPRLLEMTGSAPRRFSEHFVGTRCVEVEVHQAPAVRQLLRRKHRGLLVEIPQPNAAAMSGTFVDWTGTALKEARAASLRLQPPS